MANLTLDNIAEIAIDGLGADASPRRKELMHYHFRISAPGYQRLVTALYMAGDEYLDSDAVFV